MYVPGAGEPAKRVFDEILGRSKHGAFNGACKVTLRPFPHVALEVMCMKLEGHHGPHRTEMEWTDEGEIL